MAERFKLGPQFRIVIDLAVEDDGNRAVLVEHRLVPAIYVDDRKAAMAEADASFEMETVTVRAAMCQRVGHSAQQDGVNLVFRMKNSSQSAHATSFSGAGKSGG
jgi:hypothetical protein